MGLIDKNMESQKKTTFSISKEVLLPYLKSTNPIPEKLKDTTAVKTDTNISEKTPSFNQLEIKKIEDYLKLTFLYEKDEDSYVCMANNPEVRDEYKDIFDLKDLVNYIYAVIHSPSNLEKYKDLSKVNFFEIRYPNDVKGFWKLVDLGAKLRALLKLSSVEKRNDENYKILNEIAKIQTK